MKKKLSRKKFLDWYFCSAGDYASFGSGIVDELKDSNQVVVTVQSILDTCGYVPGFLIEGEDSDAEFQPNECELVD